MIVDRYITKKFALNLLIGIAGSVVIFFSMDLFAIIEEVTAGKLALLDVPLLSLKSIPSIISYEMMHLASLIAALLTMNDLNNNLEIVAMKTSGISFLRIIRAPLILCTALSFGMFFFTEGISVSTFKQKKEAFQQTDKLIISRNRNNIYYKSGNKIYRIANVNGYNNTISRIQIVEVEGENIVSITNAMRGSYDPESKKWTLNEVVVNLIDKDEFKEYDTYEPNIEEAIEDFLRYDLLKSKMSQDDSYEFGKELSFKEIRDNINFLQRAGGNYRRLLTHVHHQRVAYPFSIVIMAAIGFALLSKFSREGKSKAIMWGILVGFLYYVIAEIAKAMGFGSVVPMFLSAWIPNGFFAILGAYLLFKADR